MKLFICALLFPFASHADVLFSVEYRMRPDTMRNLKTNFDQAAARADKSTGMLMPVFNDQGTLTPFYVSCEAGQPAASLEGCRVIVQGSNRGGAGDVRASFSKALVPAVYDTLIANVEALLKTDANLVSQNDHKHFGNPFNAVAGDASHVYCVSEGETPNKKWECYLFTAETLR